MLLVTLIQRTRIILCCSISNWYELQSTSFKHEMENKHYMPEIYHKYEWECLRVENQLGFWTKRNITWHGLTSPDFWNERTQYLEQYPNFVLELILLKTVQESSNVQAVWEQGCQGLLLDNLNVEDQFHGGCTGHACMWVWSPCSGHVGLGGSHLKVPRTGAGWSCWSQLLGRLSVPGHLLEGPFQKLGKCRDKSSFYSIKWCICSQNAI